MLLLAWSDEIHQDEARTGVSVLHLLLLRLVFLSVFSFFLLFVLSSPKGKLCEIASTQDLKRLQRRTSCAK